MRLNELSPQLQQRVLEQVRNDEAAATEVRRAGGDRAERIPTSQPQPGKGKALVILHKRKEAGEKGIGSGAAVSPHYHIAFACYAVSPCDWDGLDVKWLQDLIVEAGFIPDDNWRVLSGSVESRKAAHRSEERTVVTIKVI